MSIYWWFVIINFVLLVTIVVPSLPYIINRLFIKNRNKYFDDWSDFSDEEPVILMTIVGVMTLPFFSYLLFPTFIGIILIIKITKPIRKWLKTN